MQYLDRLGWPVITIKNRPVINFFRRIIHTRKIKFGKFKIKAYQPSDNCVVSAEDA